MEAGPARRKKVFISEWSLHVMIIPGILFILIFAYGPMAGAVMAFQKFIPARGWFGSEWVGLDNFTYVMQLPNFFRVVGNTVFIAVMKMAAGLVVPIAASLLLNEIRHHIYKRTVQTMIYLPHFLSWVILGGILVDILSVKDGIVNSALGVFGIEPIFFLGSIQWFPYVVVISDVWKEFGFATIVYLAALTSINPTLYEAAVIDGANRLRQTWHVTLPGMAPIIVLMSVLSLGNILNAGFEQILTLYSPTVYESGDIIDTFVYRVGLVQGQYAIATAVGLAKSVVSLFFISISYYLAYRLASYRIF